MSELDFTSLCLVEDDGERYRLSRVFPVQRNYTAVALVDAVKSEETSAHTLLTGEDAVVELPRTLSFVLRLMRNDDYARYTLCDMMKKLCDDDKRNGDTSSEEVNAVLRERLSEAAGDRFLRIDALGGKHSVKRVRRVLRACEAAEAGVSISPRVALYLAATTNNVVDYFLVRDYTRHCELRLYGETKILREANLKRFVSRFLTASEESRRRVVETALCISWR